MKRKALRTRAVLAQVSASTAKNLHYFNVGMACSFINILIVELYEPKDGLSLNKTEISYLASLVSIFNPVGALFSGLLVKRFGCKRSMLLLTIPAAAVWLTYYLAESATVLFISTAVIGIAFGFCEAPTKLYAGEICEPKLRGALLTYSCIFIILGMTVPAALGVIFPWRIVAAICTTVPILTFCSIAMVPDSPVWLVEHGRIPAAEKSLRWLRGWTTSNTVREELEGLVTYCKDSKERYEYGRSLMDKLRAVVAPDNLRPTLLVMKIMLIHMITYNSMIYSYQLQIYEELHLPLGANWTLVLDSILALVFTLVTSYLVTRLGRRPVVLFSATSKTLVNLLLGCYVRWGVGTSKFAQVLILMSTISNFLGIFQVPWMLISEVFPLRTRELMSGLAGAFHHVIAFGLLKSFLPLKDLIGMDGIYWMSACGGIVGVLYMYWHLPETEGKSLQDIEKIFNTEHQEGLENTVLMSKKSPLNVPEKDREDKPNKSCTNNLCFKC